MAGAERSSWGEWTSPPTTLLGEGVTIAEPCQYPTVVVLGTPTRATEVARSFADG